MWSILLLLVISLQLVAGLTACGSGTSSTSTEINTGGNSAISQISADDLDVSAREFLRKDRDSAKIDLDDLKPVRFYCDEPFYKQHTQGICSIFYRQYYNNIPVFNSLVGVTTVNGKVVLIKNKYYPEINNRIMPKVTQENAEQIAQALLDASERADRIFLTIYPKQNKNTNIISYHPTWQVEMPLTKGPKAMTYFIDIETGEVIAFIDRVTFSQISGNVKGMIYPEHFMQEKVEVPFKHNNIKIAGFETITDEEGNYELNNPALFAPVTLESMLEGPYVKVINDDKEEAKHEAMLNPSVEYSWNWSESDQSYDQEESNVFYHINLVHDFFTKGDPFNIPELDDALDAHVEFTEEDGSKPECNAYNHCFKTAENGTSCGQDFYAAGEFCNSTALSSDVIYHEYTHSIVARVYDVFLEYWDEQGGMNEGLADYFATTINGNSCYHEYKNIGNPACGRELKNTFKYPEDYTSEPHDAGRVFSASLWDIREALGNEITDDLTIRAMKLQPLSFAEFITSILIIDDNDQDLSNGTPHINEICQSFYDNHGLYSPSCVGHTQLPIAIIKEPFDKQIFGGGEQIIIIKGTVAGGSAQASFKNYKLEYADSNGSNNWKNDKITLTGGEIIDDTLGVFDVNNLTDGVFFIKLTVTDQLDQINEYEVQISIDKTIHPGWPQQGDSQFLASPVVADLDQDGLKEIIVGQSDGYLYRWNSEGQLFDNWPVNIGNNVKATVAIGDLDNDGIKEIVSGSNNIKVINKNGKILNELGDKVWGSPSLADLDNDGQLEIVAISSAGLGLFKINVWDSTGGIKPGWPFEIDDKLLCAGSGTFSSPAVGDIDNDGDKEIVIESTTKGGKVYAFHNDGSLVDNWPKTISEEGDSCEGGNLSSPALVDIDKDGDLEIFVGSPSKDGKVYGWHHDGTVLDGWPKQTEQKQPSRFHSSPVIADLDDDNNFEIIIVTNEAKLYAWHSDGNEVEGSPIEVTWGNVSSSLVIGDIDEDGDQEILIGSADGMIHQYVYSMQLQQLLSSVTKSNMGSTELSLTLDDVDADGLVEVVVSSFAGVSVWDLPGEYNQGGIKWPKFRYDLKNTGCVECSEKEIIDLKDTWRGGIIKVINGMEYELKATTSNCSALMVNDKTNKIKDNQVIKIGGKWWKVKQESCVLVETSK
jgi:Zn-dependent metalloprotease